VLKLKHTYDILIGLLLAALLVWVVFRKTKKEPPIYAQSEFDSPDLPGSGIYMKPSVIERLESMTRELGYKLTISSGFRTAAHNRKVGGVVNSRHLSGRAVDIDTIPSNHAQVLAIAKKYFPKVLTYSGHIHVAI